MKMKISTCWDSVNPIAHAHSMLSHPAVALSVSLHHVAVMLTFSLSSSQKATLFGSAADTFPYSA